MADAHKALRAILEANRLEMGERRAKQVHACAGLALFIGRNATDEEIGDTYLDMLETLARGLLIEEEEIEEVIMADVADFRQWERRA